MKQKQGFFGYLLYPFSSLILFLPFGLVVLVKLVWALFLFYSVQWPLKFILARLITRFYGPLVLHYPAHIWWMYSILKKTSWWFDVLLGAIASYILVRWLWRCFSGENIKVRKFPLLIYLFVSVLLFYLGQVLFPREAIRILPGTKLTFWPAMVVFNAFLQAMFTPPLIQMALSEKVVGFFEGFRLLSNLFWRFFLVTVLAFLFLLPWVFWEGNFLRLAWVRAYPEFSLGFVFTQDVVSVLVNTLVHSVFVGWIYEAVRSR